MSKIKALTILQPWASLIALGAKRIETRSWYTSYRGPMAIHAGRSRKFINIAHQEPFFSALKTISQPIGDCPLPIDVLLPVGEVVAVCRLVNCKEIDNTTLHPWRFNPEELSEQEKAFGDFTLGRYAWILEDVRMLPEPIPAKGRLGLWNWEPPEGVL